MGTKPLNDKQKKWLADMSLDTMWCRMKAGYTSVARKILQQGYYNEIESLWLNTIIIPEFEEYKKRKTK